MDNVTDETMIEYVREGLRRWRPQDEISAIRRLRTHYLVRSLGEEHLSSPLSLVNPDTTVTPSDMVQGDYARFVKNVQRNLELREEFAKMQEKLEASVPAVASTTTPCYPIQTQDDVLERKRIDGKGVKSAARLLHLQLEVNRMERKRDRLTTVHHYLDDLDHQPAASPSFLDPEIMYKGCTSLPELPEELLDGFAAKGVTHEGLPVEDTRKLLAGLRRAALRNRLIEQLKKKQLGQLKSQHSMHPSSLPQEMQLHALGAVKDYLINWIETMLSKAGDDDEAAESLTKSRELQYEELNHEAQIVGIQRMFEGHIRLRKEVLSSLVQLGRIQAEHHEDQPRVPGTEAYKVEMASSTAIVNHGCSAITVDDKKTSEPFAFLCTPYLEKLQQVSREQKELIQEKSFVNARLAKRRRDSNEALDHLGKSSYLFSRHPALPTPHNDDSASALTSTCAEATKEPLGMTQRIKSFLYSVDTAKLESLEVVAEKVEEGHGAVDEAMRTLDEARKLLNMEEKERAEAEQRTLCKDQEQKGIWAKLDGNLGLING